MTAPYMMNLFLTFCIVVVYWVYNLLRLYYVDLKNITRVCVSTAIWEKMHLWNFERCSKRSRIRFKCFWDSHQCIFLPNCTKNDSMLPAYNTGCIEKIVYTLNRKTFNAFWSLSFTFCLEMQSLYRHCLYKYSSGRQTSPMWKLSRNFPINCFPMLFFICPYCMNAVF